MIGQLIIEGLAIGACYGLFGIAVVIIYNRALDPARRVEYSLVLMGRFALGSGKMDFDCLSGPAAMSALAAATP